MLDLIPPNNRETKTYSDAGLIEAVEPIQVDDCEIVQVTGALGHGDTAIDGPGLAFTLAQKLGGTCHLINAPALVEHPAIRKQLMTQSQTRKAIAKAVTVDVVLQEVGVLDAEIQSYPRRLPDPCTVSRGYAQRRGLPSYRSHD